MSRRLLLATHNAHKARELQRELDGLALQVLTLAAWPVPVTLPPETGRDFAENAALKARAVFAQTKEWSLADDSGLAVDALGGAPGVYSARYAGEPGDDAQNNVKLLKALADLPAARRTAAFVCVLCLVTPAGEWFFRGECRGHIAPAPRGTAGFGYDPLFVPEGEVRTFGEMTAAEKAARSHRHVAAVRLAAYLRGEKGAVP